MRLRRTLPAILLTAALLAGCGVSLGGLTKPPSTDVGQSDVAVVSGVGSSAFLPDVSGAPRLSTGEQSGSQPTPDPEPPRGVAGATELGTPFRLDLAAGTTVQLLVAAPARSDLVLGFDLDGKAQRIDGDPLSPDLSVESLYVTANEALSLAVVPQQFDETALSGLVRWYAWLAPSSQGQVSSPSASAGPAGITTVPGSFSFDAAPRGALYEVMVAGPPGSDLVLEVQVGEDHYTIDRDPLAPDRTVEGFTLEVDDPATVSVSVANYDGSSLAGDVRWSAISLPRSAELRTPSDAVPDR